MPVPPPEHATRVWHGNIIDLWAWDQELYDGTTTQFECITRPDTVAVLPFLDETTVLLTRQMQPHRAEPFMDLPGGRVDPGESHLDAARREFQEETGYRAKTLTDWSGITHRGVARFEERLFIATGLEGGFPTHRDAGERIECLTVPWDELVRLCLDRKLRGLNSTLSILQMAFDTEAKVRLETLLRRG